MRGCGVWNGRGDESVGGGDIGMGGCGVVYVVVCCMCCVTSGAVMMVITWAVVQAIKRRPWLRRCWLDRRLGNSNQASPVRRL